MARSKLAATIPFLLFLCAEAGCAANRTFPGNVTQAIRDPEAMKATLASQVVGRSLADAQQFMEQEGFTCFVVRKGSFQYGPDGEHDVRHDIDFLNGRREDPDLNRILVGWVWIVALVVENDRVTEVMGRSYGLGP